MPRADQAWRIRALGPAFHALAEVNVTAWSSWVATTGNSWYAAGVEARLRLASAGYDIAAGDSWALNELSSAVRQGVGSARVNMRAFLHGLYDGDGALASARGTVFIAGISQPTADLSLYQARLQDWYEDAEFWDEISHYVNDWSQELYGDIRNYAVAGQTREARRDSFNEYLQHQISLANASPSTAASARAFLTAAYSPLANAAWQYDASFGWTNVPVELMQDYVSAQTYASASVANSRFGFAWSPRNLAGIPSGDFTAQTDALLVRLAAAIADSAQTAEAACGSTWCNRDLAGANVTTAWQTFATWKPSALAFATPTQSLPPGAPSAPVTVELRTITGTPYTAGLPVTVELTTSSAAGAVLDQRRRPLDSDTHDNDRLGRNRDERLLPRLPTRLSNDRGRHRRQEHRHPDNHNRIRRRRQRRWWGGRRWRFVGAGSECEARRERVGVCSRV